jgi:hypothetical protein
MNLNRISRALVYSVVLGVVSVLGCDSQPQQTGGVSKENQEAFESANKELVESVAKNPRLKGVAPKSIKRGRMGGQGSEDAP